MKTLTIGQRVTGGFTLLILITAIVGAFAYGHLKHIHQAAKQSTGDWIPGMIDSADMAATLKQNETVTYRHIVASSDEVKARLEVTLQQLSAKLEKDFAEYEHDIDAPADRKLFDAAKSAWTSYLADRDRLVLPPSRAHQVEQADAVMTQLLPKLDKATQAVEELEAYNQELGRSGTQGIEDDVSSAVRGLELGVAGALVVGMTLAYLIHRSTKRRMERLTRLLSDGANEVASASSMVATASQSLAQGATTQAASLEETSASMEEMSSVTKRNAEHAQAAKDLATLTRQSADAGTSDMRRMSEAMEAIKGSSDNIANIIKTIDEIAFQTNILALNAAVEAARAGEAGMGFAVVADEVRNLAQRSAFAAKETAEKIEDSIRKSAVGMELNTKVAVSLEDILGKVHQMDHFVGGIAESSQQQSQGISQVNTAVMQMDKVTQANAAAAEESAAASEELSAQAESLTELVRDLSQFAGLKVDAHSARAGSSLVRRGTGRGTTTADGPRFTRAESAIAPLHTRLTNGTPTGGHAWERH